MMLRSDDGRMPATLLIVAVCVLIIAAGVFLVRPRSRRAAAKPTPTAPIPSPPGSPPTSAAPTPTVIPASPSPTRSSPAPTPTRPSSASPTSPGTGLRLIAGPYGFQYPEGWTLSPLEATTGSAQRAHVTDPSSNARIDYLAVATDSIYNPDRTVNLAVVRQAIPCQTLTTYVNVPNRGPKYTCPPDGGRNVRGMVLIQPYPQGFRLLHVMMAPRYDAVADQILAGFH